MCFHCRTCLRQYLSSLNACPQVTAVTIVASFEAVWGDQNTSHQLPTLSVFCHYIFMPVHWPCVCFIAFSSCFHQAFFTRRFSVCCQCILVPKAVLQQGPRDDPPPSNLPKCRLFGCATFQYLNRCAVFPSQATCGTIRSLRYRSTSSGKIARKGGLLSCSTTVPFFYY